MKVKLEITSNKKVIANKPLTNLFEMNNILNANGLDQDQLPSNSSTCMKFNLFTLNISFPTGNMQIFKVWTVDDTKDLFS